MFLSISHQVTLAHDTPQDVLNLTDGGAEAGALGDGFLKVVIM